MRSRTDDSNLSRRVHDETTAIVVNHLKLKDYSRRCPATVLLAVLCFAMARITSIHDACLRLRDAPSDDTVFNALWATLPIQAELQRRLNAALRGRLPKSLFAKSRPIAIDITEIPYHGEPYSDKDELRRGKPKAGTTHFHAYGTAYVVRRGERFTIAMTYVTRRDTMKDVVQRLMQQVSRVGLRVRYLLLDRGFYGLDVVQYLHCARYPFLIPVVFRGRRAKDPSKAQGPQRFRTWKKSGWSTHVLRNKGRTREVNIAVMVDFHRSPKTKRRRRRRLVYAFWGFQPPSPRWVAEQYRLRFAIEASYRQMNQARMRTCTRNPVLRLLFVGLALIVRNVWVWIHRQLARRCGRDGLILNLARLRFRTLTLHLQRFAEALLGRREVYGPQPPPS